LLPHDEVTGLKFALPKIYPITDTGLSGLSHAEQTKRFIDGGATLIQLRDKNGTANSFFEDASAAIELARRSGARVIINDRVDIALMTGADGVHLGQDDLSPAEARRILGASAIIGFSTHTVDQAEAAARMSELDYLAFGPIFPTVSKADPDPVVGLEALKTIRNLVGTRPVVAIGGITGQTLSYVLDLGADSVAMIGELYRSGPEIGAAFKRLTEIADAGRVKSS
jgi:thiamine-phosphate pyrophosphorylase